MVMCVAVSSVWFGWDVVELIPAEIVRSWWVEAGMQRMACVAVH